MKSQKKQESAITNWCFTYNNPAQSPQQLEDLLRPLCNGYVFQLEKAETGTPHYQGCIRLIRPKRPQTMSRDLFKAHWTVTRDLTAAWDYCMKDDTRMAGPWTFGNGPVTKGQRNDLVECAAMVKKGKTLTEIAEVYPGQVVRYAQHLDRFRSLYSPVRTEELQVILLLGRPGTGKTRWAYHQYPSLYATPLSKDLWFNNYQQQKTVLIDDFHGNIPLILLLRLLDRYPIQVPTKGGFVWWCPTMILLTSNTPVTTWYDFNERQDSYEALIRRLTKTIHFPLMQPFDGTEDGSDGGIDLTMFE